jgi:hypothetical protein
MTPTRQGARTRNACSARNLAARSGFADMTLRSRPGSALIERDDSRPIEIPDAFLDALVQRLARRLAERMADQLAGLALLEGSPWMTFEEAVEYTRVPAGTFRKLSAEGTFTAYGGKRKVYHRQELDAALLGLSA